jgi:hypothetical protein
MTITETERITVTCFLDTDVSEDLAASIFRVKMEGSVLQKYISVVVQKHLTISTHTQSRYTSVIKQVLPLKNKR